MNSTAATVRFKFQYSWHLLSASEMDAALTSHCENFPFLARFSRSARELPVSVQKFPVSFGLNVPVRDKKFPFRLHRELRPKPLERELF